MVQSIHPLIGKLLMKDAPFCIAGKPGDVKHIGHSLKDLDATQGWQWTQEPLPTTIRQYQ